MRAGVRLRDSLSQLRIVEPCLKFDPAAQCLGHASPYGSNWGSSSWGGGLRRGIDEKTLKQVAALTGARYYSIESVGELQQVFRELLTYLIAKHQTTEVTVFFVAAGAIPAALAMLLALRRHPLI
jgi:hypothetical protein